MTYIKIKKSPKEKVWLEYDAVEWWNFTKEHMFVSYGTTQCCFGIQLPTLNTMVDITESDSQLAVPSDLYYYT
jgi:hypothetical protein